MKPLYGFGRKRIEPVRVITLPVSFDTPKNPRTEFITFDVVNMIYPYNAIFRRGLLNTFKATLHSAYLSLQCHFQKRSPKHIQSHLTLGLPLPQNSSNLWSYICVQESARSQKHREGFHARPQKCTFPVRRPKAAQYLRRSAQSRGFSRMQESHRTRR
jgi:hypothetical protein